MDGFYVLRYAPEVPLTKRKHPPTVGRYDSWLDAEDARLAAPAPELLEVLQRGDS